MALFKKKKEQELAEELRRREQETDTESFELGKISKDQETISKTNEEELLNNLSEEVKESINQFNEDYGNLQLNPNIFMLYNLMFSIYNEQRKTNLLLIKLIEDNK